MQRLPHSCCETRATDTPLSKELVDAALELVRERSSQSTRRAGLEDKRLNLDNKEKLQRSRKKRELDAEERDLVDWAFVDEEEQEWCVVDVYWFSTQKGICVDYYGVTAATVAGHSHDWFVSGVQKDADMNLKKEVEELLNYSYVYEVFECIDLAEEEEEIAKASKGASASWMAEG